MPGDWSSDTADALIFARHIAKYHEFPLRGHFAMGLRTFYPPFQYYLLSMPVFLGADVNFILFLTAFVHSLSVFTVYLIGKLLFDEKTGFLAASFFALSTSSIIYGSTLEGANLIIPAGLLAFLFYLLFLKNGKRRFYRLALLTIIISGLIHYSILSFIPVFVFYALVSRKLTFRQILTDFILVAAILLLFHLPNLVSSGQSLVFHYYRELAKSVVGIIDPVKIGKNLQLFIQSVYYGSEDTSIAFYYLIILLLFITVVNPTVRTRILSKVYLLCLFILSTLILAPLVEGFCCRHYFTSTTPLYFILMAVTFREYCRSFSGHKLLKLIFLPLLIAAFYSLSGNFTTYSSTFRWAQKLANIVTNDVVQIRINNKLPSWNFFRAYYFTDYNNDASLEILYFLDKKINAKIISIIDSQIVQTNESKYVYLVCLRNNKNGCLVRLHEQYKLKLFDPQILWQGIGHVIYRFKT